MEQQVWSYSKLKTLDSCKWRFFLNYIEKWYPINAPQEEFSGKGLAVHEVLENMIGIESIEQVRDLLQKMSDKYKVDNDKFPIMDSAVRLFTFWNHYVNPLVKKGYQVKCEYELRESIKGHKFTGYIDLLLIGKEDAYIIDYKTSKGTQTSLYKKQLLLYSYMLSQQLGWNTRNVKERIKPIVFFPLAEIAMNRFDTSEQVVAKCVKPIKFFQEEVDGLISLYIQKIEEAYKYDWKHINSDSQCRAYDCRWCNYQGSKGNEQGFLGCCSSVEDGCFLDPAIIFEKKKA
jgi:hypothetical protein